MDSEFFQSGLDFEDKGYFAWPEHPLAAGSPSGEDAEAWLACDQAFRLAREQGDFSRIGQLHAMRKSVTDVVWQGVACTLVGDAGPDAVMIRIMEELRGLRAAEDFEYAIDLCRELRGWGRIDVAPLLLQVWEQIAKSEDALIILVWLSELLAGPGDSFSDPEPFGSIEAYRNAVSARYRDRLDKLGSNTVFVLRGARFGVERLARQILGQIREPHFPDFLRRQFEASTGMDCTPFYESGQFQPFVAKMMIETFLDSRGSEIFIDGRRYFFGHPVG